MLSVAKAKTFEADQTGNQPLPELSGAEIFVQSLVQQGVETVFGYPGGVVLSVYDTLFKTKNINHFLVRHEQGGTHAADGYARATGKPGVVLATSGPGATNTVTGIATAFMDSIPLVIFTGQVPLNLIGNDAFQEADILGITRPITKHSYLVRDVSELADTISKAFHIAVSGRPGPVLVDIPKDVLLAKAPYNSKRRVKLAGYKPMTKGSYRQIMKAVEMIGESRRPVIYAGGGVMHSNAAAELREFAQKLGAPVTTTLLGLGAYPESDDLSLGMLGMHGTWYANMAVSESDLLIAIGARFDDRVTGRIADFAKNAQKIHIDIDPASISKNVEIDLPIVGDVKHVLSDLIPHVNACDSKSWLAEIKKWKADHPLRYETNGPILKPQQVIQAVSEVTKGQAIVASDVGQHQMWTAQYYQFSEPRSHLSSGGLGTMGYGFPAAMGAAVGRPDRTAVAIVGDGGFQMTAMELATAVHYKIPVKIVILNNGYLGMVRQWQELFFEKRYSHSDLDASNPDFVKMAECYGAIGYRAHNSAELDEALKKMMAEQELPVLVDAIVDREENVYPMVPAGAAIYEMIEEDAK
ncbi:MAG: biosynthetic-type acetolactate synthase large subunit [Deferribacteres bacterium]|nr:biosynthetic-type acetolactate synthase large subunit [candidate division KSB1 bacterium]MCB9510931.1 biosynthetic-type acetolactate synthase large subunit [Deferribacteres bacterium]